MKRARPALGIPSQKSPAAKASRGFLVLRDQHRSGLEAPVEDDRDGRRQSVTVLVYLTRTAVVAHQTWMTVFAKQYLAFEVRRQRRLLARQLQRHQLHLRKPLPIFALFHVPQIWSRYQ